MSEFIPELNFLESELLELCRAVYDDVKKSIFVLEGTNEANEFMFVGADGTDTKRIDLAAEEAMIERFKQYCA